MRARLVSDSFYVELLAGTRRLQAKQGPPVRSFWEYVLCKWELQLPGVYKMRGKADSRTLLPQTTIT